MILEKLVRDRAQPRSGPQSLERVEGYVSVCSGPPRPRVLCSRLARPHCGQDEDTLPQRVSYVFEPHSRLDVRQAAWAQQAKAFNIQALRVVPLVKLGQQLRIVCNQSFTRLLTDCF